MNPPRRHQRQRRAVDVGVQADIVDHHAQPTRAGHRGQLAWFIVVGSLAAAVHWGVVVALVRLTGWPPLLANVPGWLVAFGVSFFGHHRLTFRAHGAGLRRAAWRFFGVSAMGFVVNQSAYALLLGWTGLRFDLLLAAVLLAVAALTYLLSRHWVFLRSPGP